MAPRPFSSRWFRHSVVTGWLLWLYHKTEVVTKIQPGTTRRDLENWKWGNMAENNKKLIQNWVAPQITWFQSKNGDFFGDKRDQYYKALLSTSRGALLPHVPHKLHSKRGRSLKIKPWVTLASCLRRWRRENSSWILRCLRRFLGKCLVIFE